MADGAVVGNDSSGYGANRGVDCSKVAVETIGNVAHALVVCVGRRCALCVGARYFNSEVVDGQVEVLPCAYLYNYPESHKADVLEDPRYDYYTEKAKVFYYEDIIPFSEFIDKNIRKTDGNETLKKIENGKLTVSSSLQILFLPVKIQNSFFAGC